MAGRLGSAMAVPGSDCGSRKRSRRCALGRRSEEMPYGKVGLPLQATGLVGRVAVIYNGLGALRQKEMFTGESLICDEPYTR